MEAEDLRQIMALLADYGATLDEQRWDDHLALWADDCRMHVFGRDVEGKDAIGGFMRKAHRGKHLTGVPRIETHGDGARSTADFVFFRADMRLYSAGVYRDEFVRTTSGWRLSLRTIDIQLRAEQ